MQRRHENNRTADIAAGADNEVRTLVFDNPVRIIQSGHKLCRTAQRIQAQAAPEACHLNKFQRIAVAGDNILLQALLRADKADVRIGTKLFNLVRNRQGGIDMTAGATAGKNHLHSLFPPSSASTSFLKQRPRSG